jgi:hypothetical protein
LSYIFLSATPSDDEAKIQGGFMDSAPTTPSGYCQQCGALLKPGQTMCPHCHAEQLTHAASESAASVSSLPQEENRPTQPTGHFLCSLFTLLLFVTLFILLGSIASAAPGMSMAPGVGIVIALLILPALVRMCMTASRRGVSGQPMMAGEKIAVFLLTLGMTVIVIVAAGVAFFATCLGTWAIGGGRIDGSGAGMVISLAVILGGIAGLVAAILLTRFFWKISHRKRSR